MSKLPAFTKPPAADDHAQLLALINNMSDGFLSVSPLGQITLCNGVAMNLLDANGLVGRLLGDVMTVIDKNGYPIDIQKLVLGNTSGHSDRDLKLRYKDGTSLNVQINSSPIRPGYGQNNKGGFVVIFRDITPEKNLEEERDDFISVASHELRTPVAVAEGSISNAKLLAERAKVPDPILSTLESAHQQIVFLSSLINDLSMLSRADRKHAAESAETFSAGALADSLVKDYQAQAQTKHLSLQSRVSDDVGLLTTSQLYVHEILQNILTNALKYTEKGGVMLTVTRHGDGVQFSVSDTGFGIGKNEQPKLFSKFFRSEDWRVRQISGTGLGLYVSSKLAKLLGANLTMRSELNRGSVFSLVVPNMQMTPKS